VPFFSHLGAYKVLSGVLHQKCCMNAAHGQRKRTVNCMRCHAAVLMVACKCSILKVV